jgi:putative nucleotidyltransferase with HDIG domain
MADTRFGSLRHLAGRFFGALSPAEPSAQDERWALGLLLAGERELWRAMSPADRRHAVDVARESARLLAGAGIAPGREVLAAALLHDVGKVAARLGAFGRAAVTCASVALGRDRLRGRARRYVEHDRIGAELLREAGSDPFTVAWAEQHHRPAERWTIDRTIAALLKEADGG